MKPVILAIVLCGLAASLGITVSAVFDGARDTPHRAAGPAGPVGPQAPALGRRPPAHAR
jgi:hypothetical protein